MSAPPAEPSRPPEERAAPIAGAALALGAFAQIAQVLAFREVMAICHGTEILFGVVLASGLGWTALGALLARQAGRATGGRAREALAAAMALNGLLLAGEILLARALAGLGSEAAGEALPLSRAAALSLLVTAPASLLCGAEIVLALRALPPWRFATIYRAESLGAVAGGAAFTFGVAYLAGPLRTALASGLLLAAAAALALRPLPRGARALLAAGALASLLAALAPIERAAEALRWRRTLPGHALLEFHDTAYGRACALSAAGGAQVSLFHDGSLVATLERGASEAESRALADLCACLHPAPRRALLIGGTLGRFPAELLRHGLEHADALELDPILFEMARRHGGLGGAPEGVAFVGADGRRFVKRAPPASYDLVVVSAGEPDNTVANRYYTIEFFEEIRRALAPGGVLALFLPTYGAGAEYTGENLARRTGTVWRALREVFEDVRVAPVGGHLLAAGTGRGSIALDPATLGSRLEARPLAAPAITVESAGVLERVPVRPEDYFGAIFGGVLEPRRSLDGEARQESINALERALSNADCAVNRDALPAAVAESLVAGAEAAGAGGAARGLLAGANLAEMLREVGPMTILFPGAALVFSLVMVIGARARRRARPARQAGVPRGPLLLCAFATGLFAMAAEVALLAAYQSARGHVYVEIGAIGASFMAGLALGAGLGERLRGRARAAIAGIALATAAFGLLLPGAIAFLSRHAIGTAAAAGFWALMVLAGLLDGATFPLLVAAGLRGEAEGWFGGSVYAADLLGASLGALLCGAVWIPLFGMAGAMRAATAFVAAGLISLGAVRGRAGTRTRTRTSTITERETETETETKLMMEVNR